MKTTCLIRRQHCVCLCCTLIINVTFQGHSYYDLEIDAAALNEAPKSLLKKSLTIIIKLYIRRQWFIHRWKIWTLIKNTCQSTGHYQQLLQIYELGSQLFINELSSEMS